MVKRKKATPKSKSPKKQRSGSKKGASSAGRTTRSAAKSATTTTRSAYQRQSTLVAGLREDDFAGQEDTGMALRPHHRTDEHYTKPKSKSQKARAKAKTPTKKAAKKVTPRSKAAARKTSIAAAAPSTATPSGPSSTRVFFSRYVMPIFFVLGMLHACNLAWVQGTYSNVDEIRTALHKFDPQVGKKLTDKQQVSYNDGKCEFPPPMAKIKSLVVDMFFFSHSVGWFVGSIMLRNPFIAWFLSAADELGELLFKNACPNFNECWWDQLFVDLLGANLAGCVVAYFFMKYVMKDKSLWYTTHLPQSAYWTAAKLKAVFFAPTNLSIFVIFRVVTFVSPFATKDMLFIPQGHYFFKIHHALNLVITAGIYTEHTWNYQDQFLYGLPFPTIFTLRWLKNFKFQILSAIVLILECMSVCKYSQLFQYRHKVVFCVSAGLFIGFLGLNQVYKGFYSRKKGNEE